MRVDQLSEKFMLIPPKDLHVCDEL